MEEEGLETEIPCYFLCPISMQLMADPVTASSGITYDRENIEKWLFSCKNAACPVTKLQISTADLTPNHTLRRLIQAWCELKGAEQERIPTPKARVDKSQIRKLLDDATVSRKSQIFCLQRLKSIAHRDESSRNQLQQAAGAVEFLVSVVRNYKEDAMARNVALNILNQMELSESDSQTFLSDNGGFLDSLLQVLANGDAGARVHAITLLKSAFHVAKPEQYAESKQELFHQTVRILRDRTISPPATKAALQLLVELCPWGRNRVKAVEAGSVPVLIELLLDETVDRRDNELVLTALDQLCCCADGRAGLLSHGAGLAVVSKKILRISSAGSEMAVKILSSIAKHSANSRVLNEMMEVGVVAKLCLVVQAGSSQRMKERAREILRLHSRVWKDSPYMPPHLRSSYPES